MSAKTTTTRPATSSLFEARDSFFALPGFLINLCAAAGDEATIKALDSLDMTAMRMMKGMAVMAAFRRLGQRERFKLLRAARRPRLPRK